MKWLDDMKKSAAAFRRWAWLTAVLAVISCALLAIIAIELIVICVKM